jgi:hypothetical protein
MTLVESIRTKHCLTTLHCEAFEERWVGNKMNDQTPRLCVKPESMLGVELLRDGVLTVHNGCRWLSAICIFRL